MDRQKIEYINPQAKILRHLDRISAWQNYEVVYPISIEMDLSNRCNLECVHCHFRHTHTLKPETSVPKGFIEKTGDMADAELFKNILKDFALHGVKSIVWSGGGEPLTHRGYASIMQTAEDAGLSQGLYTNGQLLLQTDADFLSETLQWVVVSMDYIDADSYLKNKGGDIERATKAVSYLSGGKAVIGVSYLINEHNWYQMKDMLKLSRSLGASYTVYRPEIKYDPQNPSVQINKNKWIQDAISLMTRLKEQNDVQVQIERFVEYMNWRGHGYKYCDGIHFTAVVTPNAKMWMCCQRRGISEVGDLSKESIEVIMKRPRSQVVDSSCRIMCRLHAINKTLSKLTTSLPHEEFI